MISGGKRWPLKAPECLAFVIPVGTISDHAPQVDDANVTTPEQLQDAGIAQQ